MLLCFCSQAEFECVNSKKKQKKKGYKNSGVVGVKVCQVQTASRFVYLVFFVFDLGMTHSNTLL